MTTREKIEYLVNWIKETIKESGSQKGVIGISGGKDSTVVAMLLIKALGKENVFGVLMPNGIQKDIQDSKTVVETLGIENITVNIGDSYNSLLKTINDNLKEKDVTKEALLNIPPRLRMTTLYAIGQTIGARVVGTSNASESLVGYFTKWGDNANDLQPLLNLSKEEVVEIGLVLAEDFNIPKSLIEKTPTDGLSELTDEEKIGVSYKDIQYFLKEEYSKLDKETFDKIKEKEILSRHKKQMPKFPKF